jgi:hypothetical protein
MQFNSILIIKYSLLYKLALILFKFLIIEASLNDSDNQNVTLTTLEYSTPSTIIINANNETSTVSITPQYEGNIHIKCFNDSQCEGEGENMFCDINNRKFRCECNYGFGYSSGKCLSFNSSEFKCSYASDCQQSDENYECNDGKCKCKSDLTLNSINKCVGKAKLGDQCYYDYECNVPNSFCGKSKVCVCDDRYFKNKNECKRINCKSNEDCGKIIDMECMSGQCDCNIDYYYNRDYAQCDHKYVVEVSYSLLWLWIGGPIFILLCCCGTCAKKKPRDKIYGWIFIPITRG